MNKNKRILILGGGYAGVAAAKSLLKTFKKDYSVDITLIDRHPYHTLMTELHEVAGNRVEQESVQVSFRKIFGARRINLVQDTITGIDFNKKQAKSAENSYNYDYLLLGVGGEPEDFGIPGIKEHSFTLWSFKDALRLREQIESRFFQASNEPMEAKRKKLLTFAVAGAGFTGVEMAGEILEWKKLLAKKYYIQEKEVRILLIEAIDRVLPMLPEHLQKKAHRYMEKKGIEIMLCSKITRAEEGAFIINGSNQIEASTLIWTCGVQGCEFAGNLAITKGKCANKKCTFATTQGSCGVKSCQFAGPEKYISGKRGRLLVNDFMQSPDYPEVYIAGDVSWYLENNKVIPQIVETALQTGECAAHNITADIKGKDKKPFKSAYHGFMVSIGSKWGVAHVMNMSLSGFFALAVKHLINIHYLLGLAGLNAVWGYLQHEFFNIRHKRSIARGHLSAKVPNYWVFFLRMFMGVMWLIEGIKKILDGWLLEKNAGWINRFMFGIVPAGADAGSGATDAGTWATDAATAATDAVAAATDAGTWATDAATAATDAVAAATEAVGAAAADAATWATDAVVATGAAAADLVQAATRAANAAGGVFFPAISQPWGLYNWIIGIFIGDGTTGLQLFFATLFRYVVVLGEVAIGLALIGGLFTFLASAGSIVLGLMFIMSGMATREILWYIVGSIVLLGGSGKGLGLDHWVMPWLKKWWNGTRLAKKTYLYLDEPSE